MSGLALRGTLGAPPGFPYLERDVCRALGLNKDEGRGFRKSALKGAVDFVTHKKRLYLSSQGVERLQEAVGLAFAEKVRPSLTGEALMPGRQSAAPEKNAAQKGVSMEPAAIVELKVVRADLGNGRMILGCALSEDYERPKKTVRIRVRETRNFKRGMVVPGVLVPGYVDLYDLARACPRKKGQW